ncbi:MAG: hypothetical protein CM1200mP17_16370 [Woeseia sp.]|nr:MAG: hypothetical protein CM1200mP17_16370 [Woeseia sp.]
MLGKSGIIVGKMFSYLRELYMHAVFLDYKTVDANDLDLGAIKGLLPEIVVHAFPRSRSPRAYRRAEVAIANKVFEQRCFEQKSKIICVTATGKKQYRPRSSNTIRCCGL